MLAYDGVYCDVSFVWNCLGLSQYGLGLLVSVGCFCGVGTCVFCSLDFGWFWCSVWAWFVLHWLFWWFIFVWDGFVVRGVF